MDPVWDPLRGNGDLLGPPKISRLEISKIFTSPYRGIDKGQQICDNGDREIMTQGKGSLMDITINRTVRRAPALPYRGEGFLGLHGEKAEHFLNSATYTPYLETITFRSLHESFDTQPAIIYTIQINGAKRGCYVDVGGIVSGVYAYTTPEGEAACLKMLRECFGNTYEDHENWKDDYSASPANELYRWEADYFKEARYSMNYLAQLIPVSVSEARRRTTDNLLDFAETIAFVQQICDDYRLFNVDVKRFSFGSHRVADCLGLARLSNRRLNDRGATVVVEFCQITFKHIIAHEMAHIINYVQDGVSGHGNRFRRVYEELLRRYDIAPNVEIPKLPLEPLKSDIEAFEVKAEKEICEMEGGQF